MILCTFLKLLMYSYRKKGHKKCVLYCSFWYIEETTQEYVQMYVEYEYLCQFVSGMQSGSNPSKDRGFREFEGDVFDLFRKIKSQNIRSFIQYLL